MEQDYRRFLNPVVLAKLGNLELIARLVVEGFLVGLHKSPYHGFSVEFAEYRQYNPGDPPKSIDWKVFARTDRFYVKEFEEETNLRSYILLDKSASMGFSGGDRITKLEYGRFLAAALAYLMVKQKDAVGLLTFDEVPDQFVPSSMTKTQLMEFLKALDRTKCTGRTKIDSTFPALAERLKKRGLVIMISDLLDDPERTIAALKHFRHRGNEVIVFHILDPAELSFDFKKEARFVDMETGEKLPIQPWMVRDEYRKNVQKFFAELKYRCQEFAIDYNLITTDKPYDIALLAYLHKRKMLY
ncbi:DUF58 domain-containing protein [bacterium]|nr:DUF58 domain-containing protein [bacterium]